MASSPLFNPFDLKGPAFLVFYAGVGIVVNMVLRSLVRKQEAQQAPARWDYTDPYKIAFLRAGAAEVLRTTIFSLIDRGLLKSTEDQVVATPAALDAVKRPAEQEIVKFFTLPRKIAEVFGSSTLARSAEGYRTALISEGLLSGQAVLLRRLPAVLTAIALLIGIALIKTIIAFMRGRHNVTFLIIFTAFFSAWTLTTLFRQRTGAGDEVLHQMKLRFRSLQLRAASLRPGGMTSDAVFLIAVFGLAALPDFYFPYIKTLFQKTVNSPDSSSSGGCGSGDSGSGGCGGGGCGGGCGGCGG